MRAGFEALAVYGAVPAAGTYLYWLRNTFASSLYLLLLLWVEIFVESTVFRRVPTCRCDAAEDRGPRNMLVQARSPWYKLAMRSKRSTIEPRYLVPTPTACGPPHATTWAGHRRHGAAPRRVSE